MLNKNIVSNRIHRYRYYDFLDGGCHFKQLNILRSRGVSCYQPCDFLSLSKVETKTRIDTKVEKSEIRSPVYRKMHLFNKV